MKNIILALALLSAAAAAFATSTLKPFEGPTPPLRLTDMQDNEHTLEQHLGKAVMVQFWATYCTPCRTEMPSMNNLAEKLGGRLDILAVNMGEQREDVQRFIDEVKPSFTMLLDPEGRSIKDWKVFAVPSTFIIDAGGTIRYTLYGPTEWDTEEMVALLSSLAQ